MTTGIPRLSIGLPVFNGENYLTAALDSLLSQSFTDFELIICDNASTDRTAEICRVFNASDQRIQYHRNETNIGAAGNYNRTLTLARGEYFKWASHDDVCLPGFLESCIAVLDSHPDVVLCHSRSLCIGIRGEVKGIYGEELAFDDRRPAQRFWKAISRPHACITVFGVMRRATLLLTIRHGDWVGADRNLLAELSLIGKTELVPELLFQRREHPEASIHKYEDESQRLAWFDPSLAGAVSFPTWRRLQEYLKAVARVQMTLVDRISCYGKLLRWVGARHHTGPRNVSLMSTEVLRAMKHSTRSHGSS